MRASTVIHKSATRRSALRAWRAGAMIMGRRAVAGGAMAPIERRSPVQGFLLARAAPARGAPHKALAWLAGANRERHGVSSCRNAPLDGPGKFAWFSTTWSKRRRRTRPRRLRQSIRRLSRRKGATLTTSNRALGAERL